MKSNLLSPTSRYSALRFSGETPGIKNAETPPAIAPVSHHDSQTHAHKVQSVSLARNKMGFWGRVGLGMQNLGSLYSAGRLNTMAGKAMLAADVLFFMMSFVPLMHFMFLLQPSVIVFLMGAVMKKRLGPTFPKV
jgi:hypothetical protein